MSIAEDLLAEGAPEKEFNPGIASRMPRKRVAAGALFHDGDRFLMVEPIYKPTWDIPGGVTEEGESPQDACVREVREELGLDLPVRDLLAVDWIPAHGVWGDGVMFVFDGGTLSADQIAAIQLQEDELKSYAFVTVNEAASHVRPSLARRLANAMAGLKSGQPRYLEFGRRL